MNKKGGEKNGGKKIFEERNTIFYY